jgi:peptidoglycan hydrolase CwlO-like protein
MKKLFSIVICQVMFLTIGFSSVAAEEDKDQEKVLQLIEKTNQEIEEKIQKAVKEADELQADFLAKIREIEEKR